MTNYNRIRVVVMGSSRVGKSAVTVRYLTKRFIGEYSSSRDFLYKHTVVFDGGARTDIEILDTSKCSGLDLHPKFDGGGGGAWRPAKVISGGGRGGIPTGSSRSGRRANPGGRRIPRGGSEEEEEEEEDEEEDEEEVGGGGECWDVRGEDAAEEEEEEEHLRWGDAFVVVYSVCDRRSFRSAKRLLARLSRLHGGRHGVGDEDGHMVATPLAAPALLLGNKRDLDHAREIGVDAGQELSLRYGAQFYEVSAAQSYAGVSLAFHSLLREARSQRLLRTLSSSSSSSSPTSSSCSISSSPPPPPLFLDHFACHAALPPPPPPPTPTPLHRLLRSLSSSSSSSSASTASSSLAAGHPSHHHTLPHHRCEAAAFFVPTSAASCPSTPVSMHPASHGGALLGHSKTLPAHKRTRLGMGNSVSKVLGTIFGKNGGGGDSGGSSTSGGSDRKTKKKRPSLSI
ncbi:ras-like protein family member 12 [Hetaerina americana]|uniref:ras-like protein family member 12 n=1 Tax=Hetaerina americana TaxID=62018 RepID=UPI003A7F2F0E